MPCGARTSSLNSWKFPCRTGVNGCLVEQEQCSWSVENQQIHVTATTTDDFSDLINIWYISHCPAIIEINFKLIVHQPPTHIITPMFPWWHPRFNQNLDQIPTTSTTAPTSTLKTWCFSLVPAASSAEQRLYSAPAAQPWTFTSSPWIRLKKRLGFGPEIIRIPMKSHEIHR